MKLVWEVKRGGVSDWPEYGIPGGGVLFRSKVPGGWFVYCGGPCFFYPDPKHEWDGNSLP